MDDVKAKGGKRFTPHRLWARAVSDGGGGGGRKKGGGGGAQTMRECDACPLYESEIASFPGVKFQRWRVVRYRSWPSNARVEIR